MRKRSQILIALLISTLAASVSFPFVSRGQSPAATSKNRDRYDVAELQPPASEMRAAIERYTTDWASLTRSYPVALSPARQARFRQFYTEWLASLQNLAFDSLSQDDKVDYLLFKNHLDHEMRQLDIQAKQMMEIEPLIPFAGSITDLEEARRRMEPINSPKVAALLTDLKKQIDEKRKAVEAGLKRDNQTALATDAKSDDKVEAIKVKKTAAK